MDAVDTAVRVLTFTTLFPNAVQQNHGIFVENRLKQTLALGGLGATVIAPVPYFPFRSGLFGRYAQLARIPLEEVRHGLHIYHPRYFVIPKIGMNLSPRFLYLSGRRSLLRLKEKGSEFDLIDAHYFYPDGVAAALLGKEFGLPVMITGRGTDLTLIPNFPTPRRKIYWAARQAQINITVCQSLNERLVGLGIPSERVLTLRNGVDLDLFTPHDRAAARQKYGVDGSVLVSVGSLIPRKGHEIVIKALVELDGFSLLIAGAGPLRQTLAQLASQLGVSSRVHLLGEVPHHELPILYSAADIMVLASSREGWPNVLLEAMACGTPVVTTRVDGTAEVVTEAAAGELVALRSPSEIAKAIRSLAARTDRAATRRYAECFSWRTVAETNRGLMMKIAAQHRKGRSAKLSKCSAV